jgi:hypothetical protein
MDPFTSVWICLDLYRKNGKRLLTVKLAVYPYEPQALKVFLAKYSAMPNVK